MVWKGERPWLRQVYRLVEVEHCSLPCVFMHLEAKALMRQHHESHLLTVLAEAVSARPIAENVDPFDVFLQTRPFSASLPRRVGFWSTTDRQQQHVLRVDTQPTAQPPPQRHTDRAHHQIESALHARVQSLRALVQEIEQTVDSLPHDVQGALLTPLTDLHTQLCGLVYVAWLISLLHPHADDHDQ